MISFKWNNKLAYVIGLITADGNLSTDERHIEFTSKDKCLVENFINCLKIKNTITKKARGSENNKKYFRVQVGNVAFYAFLQKIGLHKRKSLTLKSLKVPQSHFDAFLRGYFEGDGSITWFKHPESKNLQLRVKFSAGNNEFLIWLKKRINAILLTKGSIDSRDRSKFLYYCIGDSIRILKYIYRDKTLPKLNRKYLRAKKYLRM